MSWDAVKGHDAAREQLRAAFARGRLAHAYLFAGPAGVGKRLFALELAKAVLCERHAGQFNPCDACPACQQVAAATHPDFYTAAKPEDKHDLPIDAVRAFCQHLGLKPQRGPRCVGVVEDADDFNTESANAFLKTLEEPPPGSLLILLATGTERQLPTILSRCQVVRFAPLAPAEVDAVLADHGVADAAERARLVRLAGGAPGQALLLRDGPLWELRAAILKELAARRPDPVALAKLWQESCEGAGKETVVHRARAAGSLRLVMDVLQTALRQSLAPGGPAPAGDADEAAAIAGITARAGPDELVEWLEACAEADYHVDRKVQLVLVLERLSDVLCRAGSVAA